MTYTHLRNLVILLASLVTYIHQGGILLLAQKNFVTYTHLRDLVILLTSSVTYIYQGEIL